MKTARFLAGAALALGLLRRGRRLDLRRRDPGDEDLLAPQRRHDGVHRVAGALAVDRLAAARASGECKGRHDSSLP